MKTNNTLGNRIKDFLKKEVVLCVAFVLAVVSAFLVPPDAAYRDYIDFRTLGILFCLMSVMAGLQKIGVFEQIAMRLLARTRKPSSLVVILVFLCFVFSMVITNDVALITFVPFVFTVGRLSGEKLYRRMVFPTVVLQTIAANLGSMLTPIGNPQNLYLYGISGMDWADFVETMLPYSAASLGLLTIGCVGLGRWLERQTDGAEEAGTGQVRTGETDVTEVGTGEADETPRVNVLVDPGSTHRSFDTLAAGKFAVAVYMGLFILCLWTVARIVPLWITMVAVVVGVAIVDVRVFRRVDYCLLLTFTAFFVFIGNMGRLPVFSGFLQYMVSGHEVPVAILASQCISNVPAALLLSGFTDNVTGLLICTNLGGLGTLIASMASLISYKYVAAEVRERELPGGKGRYFWLFTAANLVFLAILGTLYACIG
ncbi:MAG: citrate transporter [Lachnospiraceae bacterium]|nr:citrate transporter [Lachnospiraceae bacterium]